VIHARLILCAAALACGTSGADTPRFAPAEKSVLVKTFSTSFSLRSTSLTATRDGKPLPEGTVPAPSESQDESRRIKVTDRWVKVGDGRPLELDRTFDELVMNRKSETTSSKAKEATTKESALESDLEGKTVRFSWNAKDSKYDMTAAGEELDPELFVGLREDLDLRVLLPAKDVSVGDTWAIDPKPLNYMLTPCGNLHFHEAGQAIGKRTSQQETLADRFAENAEGEAHATLESIREKDGRRLANVKLDARLRTHGILPDQKELRGDIDLELKGQFTWDLSAQHVDAAAFTGKVKMVVTGERETTEKGQKHELTMHLEFEGQMQFDLETSAP